MNKAFLLFALPFALTFAVPAFADEKIPWPAVPAPIQKTINSHADGGKVEEVEKETKTIDGKTITIYEAEVRKRDGKKIEIEVAEDGKLIKVKDD